MSAWMRFFALFFLIMNAFARADDTSLNLALPTDNSALLRGENPDFYQVIERSLHGVTVRDVMEADPPSVGPNETVAELVNERMLRGEHRSFLVRYADGGLAGIVTLSDVRRLPSDRWADARVTDVMTRFADLATVEAELPVDRAMQILQQREVGQLPVVEGDGRTVVGMLTRLGVLRLIDNRAKLGA